MIDGKLLLEFRDSYNRTRWHNQKYYTWVEQQGKSIEELRALADPDFWLGEQSKIAEVLSTVDRAIEQTEASLAKQERIKTGPRPGQPLPLHQKTGQDGGLDWLNLFAQRRQRHRPGMIGYD